MKVQTTGRTLLHSLFRRKRMIVMLFLSIFGTVFIGTLLWPPSYEASSSILIRGRNYNTLLFPEPRSSEQATLFIRPQEEVNSEIEIIRSRPVLGRVVAALKLYLPRAAVRGDGLLSKVRGSVSVVRQASKGMLAEAGLARRVSEQQAFDATVSQLREQVRVEPALDSQIVRIVYRHGEPLIASQVTNLIADEYLKQRRVIGLNAAQSSFFAEQAKLVEDDLNHLRFQLEELKASNSIISFPEQSRTLVEKLRGFETIRANIQTEIISRRSKLESIQALRKSDPDFLIPLPQIAQDAQMLDLENKLINLRYQFEGLMQRYTENSRQVSTARDQLKELTTQIAYQVDQILKRERTELRKLEAEEQALAQTIRGVKGEIERMARLEAALSKIEKEIEDKQSALTALRQRYQDALVAQGTDYRLENVKIVSPAAVPLQPAAPKLPLNLALGGILAAVVSLSTAFFMEYWDDSLKVPEDVELRLALPVFASVPELWEIHVPGQIKHDGPGGLPTR